MFDPCVCSTVVAMLASSHFHGEVTDPSQGISVQVLLLFMLLVKTWPNLMILYSSSALIDCN